METPCRQAHQGKLPDPEQVPDLPGEESILALASCMALDLSVPHIISLLHLPLAGVSCKRPKLCPGLLNFTLLRSSIA